MGECVHFNCVGHLVYMRTFFGSFFGLNSTHHIF